MVMMDNGLINGWMDGKGHLINLCEIQAHLTPYHFDFKTF